MQGLVFCLFFIAILLFIINLHFEFQNRRRISKIDNKLNTTIIDVLETFMRWIDIKDNLDEFYSKMDRELENKEKNKSVEKNNDS